MKEKLSKSLLIAFSAFALTLGAIGCNGTPSSNQPGGESQPGETSQSGDQSQGGGNQSQGGQSQSQGGGDQSQGGQSQSQGGGGQSSEYVPQKGDENWVDYANTGTVKLELDYVGKDLYVDGIGQFSL